MQHRCVTRNLARRPGAAAWVQEHLTGTGAPAVAFLQEVPAGALEVPGYRAFFGPAAPGPSTGRVPCRSALLVTRDVAATAVIGGPLAALGTYAAAVDVQTPTGTVLLASVHTSPSRVAPDEAARLESSFNIDIGVRSCEAGPWWADVGAAALEALSDRAVVAAGDYNEALAWDPAHPGHRCGHEFFARLHRHGVTDAASQSWGGERATRRSPDYQLDRVLASAASRVRVADADPAFDDVSDHAPIWFDVDL